MTSEQMTIVSALIDQVQKAVPKGGSELDVRTIITRPLWDKFMAAGGHPPGTMPTGWLGIHKTRRVFGSETRVVESEKFAAVSFPIP